MPATFDRETEGRVDLGPYVVVVDREFRQRGRDVEPRKRERRSAEIVAGGQRL